MNVNTHKYKSKVQEPFAHKFEQLQFSLLQANRNAFVGSLHIIAGN